MLAGLWGHEENDGADDVGVDSSPSVGDLFTLLHLPANLGDECWVPRSLVGLEIFSQVLKGKVVVVVREDSRILLDVAEEVDLQVLAEWVWLLDAAWVGGENEVSELDAVLWEAVHEVEMEV